MLRLFNTIINDDITPNGLYFLFAVVKGDTLKSVDYKTEKKLLENSGVIVDNKVSQKGLALIEQYKKLYKVDIQSKIKKTISFTAIEIDYIYQYRVMFPKGVLPSGYPARLPLKDLEKRFVWFTENYDYKWETILLATKMYIDKYKDEGYMYMKTSGYFIVKNEKGVTTSTLATFCDMVLEGGYENITPVDGYNNAI